jgi:hypothetical protein
MIPRPLRAAAPLALLSLVLVACGSAPPPASVSPQEPAPTTADGAIDLLDRAENDLRLALGGGSAVPGYAQQAAPPMASAMPGPPPPAPAAAPEAAPPSSVAAGATSLAGDPCAGACRALASMERATTHLCGLAGDADALCEGARARVKNASARVHAACPACA